MQMIYFVIQFMTLFYYNLDMIINRQSGSTIRVSTSDQMQPLIPEQQPIVAVAVQQKQRLKSIDAYRGITMLGMILVDNSGGTPIWPLSESDWDGVSTADLIFPAFLFIMGFAVPLAVRAPIRPLKMFSRIIGLFAIGVFLNLVSRTFHFENLRIMGVLERLSLCYLILSLLHISTNYGQRKLQKFGAMFIILMSAMYLCFMVSFSKDCEYPNNLKKDCNFTRWLDIKVLTYNHMLKPTDPEGLFSTLSALLTAYGGYYFCLVMREHKNNRKLMYRDWSIIITFCGLCSGLFYVVMPYNKKLWSTSFALLTIAISGFFLTLMIIFIDQLTQKRPNGKYAWIIDIITRPLIWLGMNPLAIFVLMDLLAIILIRCIIIDGKSAWSYFYHYVFASWLKNSYLCSTVFSLFFAILWIFVAWIMFKFKIFIKL